MKKYFVGLTALLAMTAMVALGADVDGKWTREQAGRGGGAPTVTTLMLKSSGGTLTGTMDNGRGGPPVDISEGTITGAAVSFKTVVDRGADKGGKQETTYTGTVSPTELKLTAARAGGGGGGAKGGGGGGRGGGGEQVYTKAK